MNMRKQASLNEKTNGLPDGSRSPGEPCREATKEFPDSKVTHYHYGHQIEPTHPSNVDPRTRSRNRGFPVPAGKGSAISIQDPTLVPYLQRGPVVDRKPAANDLIWNHITVSVTLNVL